MYATRTRPNRSAFMALWIHDVPQRPARVGTTCAHNPARRTSRRACDGEDDALVVHAVIRSLVVDLFACDGSVHPTWSRLLVAELFTWSLRGVCLRPLL